MSDNWVVQNLENALNTWNEKLSEIWQLITQSPEQFKGGTIWNVIVNIHGALQAIGLALLVLFFCRGCDAYLRQLRRSQETRTRIKTLYPICSCQRRCNLWLGADDGSV